MDRGASRIEPVLGAEESSIYSRYSSRYALASQALCIGTYLFSALIESLNRALIVVAYVLK